MGVLIACLISAQPSVNRTDRMCCVMSTIGGADVQIDECFALVTANLCCCLHKTDKLHYHSCTSVIHGSWFVVLMTDGFVVLPVGVGGCISSIAGKATCLAVATSQHSTFEGTDCNTGFGCSLNRPTCSMCSSTPATGSSWCLCLLCISMFKSGSSTVHEVSTLLAASHI